MFNLFHTNAETTEYLLNQVFHILFLKWDILKDKA